MNGSKRKVLGAAAALASVALVTGVSMPAGATAPLKVGAILPLTGALSFLGDPMVAGFWAAVDEINANGGVLGSKITVTGIKDEADGSNLAISTQSAKEQIAAGANVVLGAASSGRTYNIIKDLTGAGIVQISPSNTDIGLSAYADNGYYFRTAPSDLLQGRVNGNNILAAGKKNVAIIYQQSSYGTGLMGTAKAALLAGGAKVKTYAFAENETNFTSTANSVKAQGADAILVISYDEFKKVAPALQSQGYKGNQIYMVDGNVADYSADSFAKWLTGAQGTQAGANPSKAFAAKLVTALQTHNQKKLTLNIYGAEAYDAIILAALAATEAKSTDPAKIKAHMITVSKGGVKVTNFKDAVAAINAGKDIDYEGQSGPINFDANGNPSTAYMGVYQYDATGHNALKKMVQAAVPTK
ncbi:MAG: ABC transporter substrate-binding protein [Micrococcales bacterium]